MIDMIDQYNAAVAAHPTAIIIVRVGDFYEAYNEHAETLAKVLEITLTGRQMDDERIPMSGVPYHSVEKYLARLIQAGYRIAILDQIEDPRTAKGLVK